MEWETKLKDGMRWKEVLAIIPTEDKAILFDRLFLALTNYTQANGTALEKSAKDEKFRDVELQGAVLLVLMGLYQELGVQKLTAKATQTEQRIIQIMGDCKKSIIVTDPRTGILGFPAPMEDNGGHG